MDCSHWLDVGDHFGTAVNMLSAINSRKPVRLYIRALTTLFVILFAPVTVGHAASGLNGNASALAAYELSNKGAMTLIDIRSPSEWRRSGVGKGAHKISIHEAGFVDRVDALLDGDRTRPVALICAAGKRSSMTKAKLNALGFTNVTNIPEGMFGSSAGPGWIERDLPVGN